ncbi:SAF domain-containing protein [Spirillospora sp. NBC_00431]
MPRQRRKGMLALAVLLVAVGALLATYVVSSMSDRGSVIMLSRDVPVGTPIAAADVATAMVSVDRDVATIPGSQLQDVVGKIAATDLKRGTLLSVTQLSGVQSPGQGQQVVPVALQPTQIPARGLAPGDKVLVVVTQGNQQQPQAGAAEPAPNAPAGPGDVQGTVDRVGQPDADGRIVVDLLLAAQAGPSVARQAAAGKIALVVMPRRG